MSTILTATDAKSSISSKMGIIVPQLKTREEIRWVEYTMQHALQCPTMTSSYFAVKVLLLIIIDFKTIKLCSVIRLC